MNPTTRRPFSDLSNRQLFPFNAAAGKPTVVDLATRKAFKKASLQDKPPKLASREFIVVGSWTRIEHLAFLYGLRLYGPGKWKKLCDLIPTRDNIQIKSHGQLLLRKQKNGMDIFRELDEYYHEEQQLERQLELQAQQQAQQAIMRKHTMEQNNQYFRRGINLSFQACAHPLAHQAPRVHVRPPSDVIQAACGLTLLSEAAKASKAFVDGQPMQAPALFLKSDSYHTR